jgi:hypothetical protein
MEERKSGVAPDAAGAFVNELRSLGNLHVEGLMTVEPYCEDPEGARPYFRRMRELFEDLRAFEGPNVAMKILSMGMTTSYRVAVEEGANMVRIGTGIFGPR